ncbi:MAG: beta-lactamase family protein [Treponema sp.]|jgi:CubicO group peptidase (beta-lactamase class C family)|nr:beta-lactamase family protein [Treponema sp.]
MASTQMIDEYTNNKGAILTAGVIYEGRKYAIAFNKDGRFFDDKSYIYEIGSITKTFTISLLCKAINDGKISLEDTIKKHMPLDTDRHFPTIRQLATHTAGYGNYPLNLYAKQIILLLTGKDNPFLGYSHSELIRDMAKKKLSDKKYKWNYSNFGISALGYILGEAYENGYKTAMEDFIRRTLGLEYTTFDSKSGDFEDYWEWDKDDAYLAAGGLKSNISDMLRYAEIQMNNKLPYLRLSKIPYNAISINGNYSSGLAWLIDRENGIVWHNGGTSSFNSFIGFDDKIAVIILSNIPEGYAQLGPKIFENLILFQKP